MSDKFFEMVKDSLAGERSSDRESATRLVKSDLIRTPEKRFLIYYKEKLTIAGNTFIYTQTEHPVFGNFVSKFRGKRIPKAKTVEEQIENRKTNARRSKAKVIELCQTNFDRNAKFITLTFDDSQPFDVTNIDECNVKFTNFIRRLRRLNPNIKYISTIEFQDSNDRGAVHYHMICNLPYVHWTELKKLWSHGDIHISRPNNIMQVYFYIPKYFAKNAEDRRLLGKRTFTYSRNLKKAIQIRGYHAKNIGEDLANKFEQVGKTQVYETQFHGKVTKKVYTRAQYNL